MTSNSPDSLDPALIRPGRCDQKILFGYVSEEVCIKLFLHLYTKNADEMVGDEASVLAKHDIPSLAQKFARAIPADSKFTPAEVQGFIMVHRDDPQAAVDGVEKFVREIVETRKRGANVAEFANEVQEHKTNGV